MASVYQGVEPTREAGEDLTASQYHFVKVNASDQAILPTAITDVAFGVLQNAPDINENALVYVNHQTKIVASGALPLTAPVAPAADGRAQIAVSTQYARGVVVEAAAAANDIAVIRLFDVQAPLA